NRAKGLTYTCPWYRQMLVPVLPLDGQERHRIARCPQIHQEVPSEPKPWTQAGEKAPVEAPGFRVLLGGLIRHYGNQNQPVDSCEPCNRPGYTAISPSPSARSQDAAENQGQKHALCIGKVKKITRREYEKEPCGPPRQKRGKVKHDEPVQQNS